MKSIDVIRDNPLDEVHSSKDLGQIGNGAARDAREAITEQLGEAFNSFFAVLDARLRTICFRNFVGRFDPLLVEGSPFYQLGPLVVICHKSVQVEFAFLKFCAITTGKVEQWILGVFWRMEVEKA